MIYRKRGSVARWEHGRVVMVTEAGEAIEERGVFEVRPLSGGAGALAGPLHDVSEVARAIARIAKSERLIVSHGIAEHECNGITWKEETRRLHVSLTHKHLRALIDRADFELADIVRIARLLKRAGAERDAPPRLRLAPSVAAALLPSLVGVAPPNVTLWQTAGGLDGNGEEIREVSVAPAILPATGPGIGDGNGNAGRIAGATLSWPNVFRPSYRIRPVRTPLNLRLECDVDVIDRDLPEAVALLAPVAGLMLRVLVADARRVYPATIRVTRIDAVARERSWYPYAAGAFGSEIML
jgi:hypothetical protein